MDRFADDGKLGQGFTSADDLVEVDIGDGDLVWKLILPIGTKSSKFGK